MTLSLLLKCADLEETKAFYSEILEFDVSDTPEETCTVRKSGASIIFTADDLWEGHPHCTGTLYFFLPDVDEYYDAVKHKAFVRWPLEDMSYGLREFGVKDCNGYTLAFAKRI
jgi:predicted enzyme related to lactoylglutathione lyase